MTQTALQKSTIYYSIAKAAKRLGVSYNVIKYAIGSKWLNTYQDVPEPLIEEGELFRYAREKNISIPEK